jgi:hypothetical protein
MATSRFIAYRTLLAADQAGREFSVVLAVGTPYEISEVEWACPVGLEGLHDRLRDQHGIDSWQALQLAQSLVFQLLTYFIEDGGKLYWPDTRNPVSLREILPGSKEP